MVKIVFDTNIYDAVYQDQELWRLLCDVRAKGLVDLIVYDRQLDQIRAMPDHKDPQKKMWMLYAVGTANTTETYGSFPDLSREGWSKYAPEGEVIKFVEGKTLNEGNQNDALIASTAFHEGHIFITNETSSLPNRYKELGGNVMNSSELKVSLQEFLEKNSNTGK